MRYLDGLATTLAGAAIPYGYTLVVWSTGSLVADHHNRPDIWDVALFAAGAAAGYALLRVLARGGDVHPPEGIGEHGIARAAAVQAAAIAAAVAVAAGVAHLHGVIAWAIAPLLATLAYLSGTAINEAREIAASSR